MEQGPVAQEAETPTRVDDLWFTKDIIVIRAENKIFQVSGGILAARSTVFRDMFAFPQPTRGDIEQIDGSPVVRLHDSARDVEVFLRAIYDSSYFMPAPVPVDLRVILAILRLSHKYDIQYLYLRALNHLAKDGWYKPAYDDVFESHLLESDSDVGALWFLPWAYYCTSTFSAEDLLPLRQDQTEQFVKTSLLAQLHLSRATIAVNRFLTMRDACATAPTCNRIRDTHLARVLNQFKTGEDLEPHAEWDAKDLEGLKTEGMCDFCYALAETRHHEAMTAFWDTLPSIFGLPPWKELRKMKRAAMDEDEEN
ncbi:hypothetical protein FB451DRAFT_1556640 [Mycena latifolia]|nr:hypothetical protein FB451DRAFT_1556640 [Mycena latifolia]